MCTLYQNKKWSKQKPSFTETADDGCCGRSSGGRKCPRTDLGRMHHPTLPGRISWCVSYTSTELSCLIYTETGKQEVGRNTASSCLVLGARPPHPRKSEGGSAEGRRQAQPRRGLTTATSSLGAQAEAKAAPSSETKARWVGPPWPSWVVSPPGAGIGRGSWDTGPDGSGSEAASHTKLERSSKCQEPRDGHGAGPGGGAA